MIRKLPGRRKLKVRAEYRQRKVHANDSQTPTNHIPYQRPQSLGKAVSRVRHHLPYSPPNKAAVMTGVAQSIGVQLDVKMKTQVNGPTMLSEETTQCVQTFYTMPSDDSSSASKVPNICRRLAINP